MASRSGKRRATADARAANAERNRRYRRHQKGDHSLCDPQRLCEVVEAAQQVPAALPAPAERVDQSAAGTRGGRLAAELLSEDALGPGERVLAEEAGRIVDRLDKLDRYLRNRDDWLSLALERGSFAGEETVTVVVKVTGVLTQAREQALALRALVADLSKAAGAKRPATAPIVKGSGIASLADAAARRRKTAR